MRTFILMVAVVCMGVFFQSPSAFPAEPESEAATAVSGASPEKEGPRSGDLFRSTPVPGRSPWTQLRKFLGSRVLSAHGDTVGWVDNFIYGARGYVAFAILASPGPFGIYKRLVAVPWDAITSSSIEIGHNLVVKMEKDEFASAPSFSKAELRSQTWAENTYRFFGLDPVRSESLGPVLILDGRATPSDR